MAALVSDSATSVTPITEGWELCLTQAGRFSRPEQVDGRWVPAIVPGTAAAALERAGLWSGEAPTPLHDQDVWYRVRLSGSGTRRLRLGGLATLAEVWLDGERVLASENMFLAHEIDVVLQGESWLHIGFRSLDAALAARKGPRARWRTQMIPDQKLRFVRTTLLGHMPGWGPDFDAVGPWRPVELIEHKAEGLAEFDLRTEYEGTTGRLSAVLRFEGDAPPGEASLTCGGSSTTLVREGADRLQGELSLPEIVPWWPHTHGQPVLHPVDVRVGGRHLDCGRVGFRRIAIDRGLDGRGFRLLVNDVPVFCRGAVWMPPDPVGLGGSREDYAGSLALAREAGVNMFRVPGTALYESRAFHDGCDELGILVWQDAMFANFDYPASDEAFLGSVKAEAEQLLRRLQASPSLAILCGGSEVAQQAAMLGLPPASWSNRIVDSVLPELIAEIRPDTIFVPSSPFGGALPFQADAGCTHYFGVGAYRRPLEDARRAGVRFASECLAFANVPEPATLREALPVPAVHDPRWKAGVPRDLEASWDFEDVRDHYLALLYQVDPPRLRTEDPERYLALSRAIVADVMEAAIGEWRRPGSSCSGALVLQWQDLRPGAGWGVLDSLGRPKSVWHALRRAFRPVQILISDEGVNGLHLHALNDGPEALPATVSFACLREGRLPVASAERSLRIPARGGLTLSANELLGRFFDTNYAYRFGPPKHDVCIATLTSESGAPLATASFWLPGRRTQRHPLGLAATVSKGDGGWLLRLTTQRMATGVAIDDERSVPDDNHFDLAAGVERIVRLRPLTRTAPSRPEGEISAINGTDAIRYRGEG